MKKTFRTFLTLLLLVAGTAMSWAEFKDFSAILNNGTGTMLLPSEYAADQTQVETFGIAVDAEGVCSRVTADDPSAVATVAGKYWNNHGMNNLVVTIPNVSGTLKITTANCQHSNDRVVKDANGNTLQTISHGTNCYASSAANVTESYVIVGETPQTITINGGNYCGYVKVEKSNVVVNKYNVTFANNDGDAIGEVPAAIIFTEGDAALKAPKNFTLYKEGYTLTGWNDGAKTYSIGEEFTPVADMTMEAVFTQNTKTLADRTEAVTMKWDFQRNNGAPTLSYQNIADLIYVTQATVDGETIDVKVDYSTNPGKIANGSWGDWCQMNEGTTFVLPSCAGATFTIESYNATQDLTVNGVAATGNTNKTYSTTIDAEDATATVVIAKDGSYYRYLQMVLPYIAPKGHTWDFTKWSDETKTNLAAAEEWSNDEKNNGTTVTGCYWQVAHGTLTANGQEIAELKGLEFTNTNDRALAIATNYPTTSLGTYEGAQYLWLGGKNMAYFTIKNVKVGTTIKMGVESHKPAEARGITLTNVASNPDAPTTYTEQEWTVTGTGELVDVTVTNTNGCHIYWIDAEIGEKKPGPTPEGEDFVNVAGQVKWAVGNETKGTIGEDIADAVLETKVSVGTDLSITNTNATYTLGAEGAVGPYVTYQPQTGNPGAVAGDMIEYTVKMKKGITFKPTSVEFDAVKEGTDGAYFSWSYTVDGVEGSVKAYNDPKTQIRRNNDANPSAPLTHKETISAEAGRTFTLRFYISNVASDKKMSIGNIKINGEVNGTEEVRAFKDFKVDFRKDPYTVISPAEGLPEGVTINGTFHDAQHGYNQSIITVPVDGPVKFTFGSCDFGSTEATITDTESNTTTVNTKNGCDNNTSFNQFVTWVYNSETPTTLTIKTPGYIPFFYAEACELLPMVNVEYYNTNGKLIGSEEIQGGSALAYKYSEADVTIPAGQKFRGWFASEQSTALKIAEGSIIQDNIKLYARATAEEVVSSTARYIYDLTKQSFYQEDHEAIEIDGKYYNNHGWIVGKNATVKVNVSEKAYITVGNCQYSAESEAIVTDPSGNQVDKFQVKADDGADGATYAIEYSGEAGWVTITFPQGAYVHSVSVANVVDFLSYDEATGFYQIASGDVSSFLLALKAASSKEGTKIYLPNGTYDLGETVLTNISGKNISIIGESMDGTIIRNCPPKEQEGIGTTATLLNNSDGLYMQDLTIQNALDYYGTGAAGRAVCLQDKGTNTICKNVKMLSYQDTYYSNRASNFYWEDSEIHGTVDYLCGDGDVVYNRCKFVNESRTKDSKSGSDVLAAPYTSASCQWGYVFLDCAIESKCKDFTFARSWGGESKAQVIRMQVLDNSLNSSRWTTGGMNVAAYKFVEFGVTDADGKVTTPASRIVEFTHNTGNKKYETVLTAEQAANYTVENIYSASSWRPDVTCQQVEDVKEGTIFLVDGKITTTLPSSGMVRIANSRGGFGPEVEVIAAKNTIVAGDYTVTAKIEALEGVKVPDAIVKYTDANGYTVKAALTGTDESLDIECAEGVFNGLSIAGDAIAFATDKTFTISGRTFAICSTTGETTGSVKLTAGENGIYTAEDCGIYYSGNQVGIVKGITIKPYVVSTHTEGLADFEDTEFEGTFDNGAGGEGMVISNSFQLINYNHTSYWNGFAASTTVNNGFYGYDDDSQYNSCTGSGNNNSNKFGVGYYSEYDYFMNEECPSIFAESAFAPEYVYVTNAAVAVKSMKNGDDFAKKYDETDWLKLIITGYTNDGDETGDVEIFLANEGKIMEDWTMVDLTPLGIVDYIEFTMDCSDKSYGLMNTPAYFCIDDFKGNIVTDVKAKKADINVVTPAKYIKNNKLYINKNGKVYNAAGAEMK